MTHSYISGGTLGQQLRQLGLTALLAGGTALAAQAQTLNYTVAGATNITSTFTDISTVAGSTVITTPNNNTDDANSPIQSIGFTFNYDGSAYTQFFLNTNGFIKLGATAPSATTLFLQEVATTPAQPDVFQSANDPDIIAPFNIDLTAGSAGGTEYRVATTGTSPNRICTIQWKNVSDKAATNPTQYANLSFQVRLYEGTNVVELVYGAAVAGTTSALRFSQAGLKGTTLTNGVVQPVKQSTAAWSTATFQDQTNVLSTNNLNTLNIRTVATPDAGRTFRFTPTAANDAAVTAVYALGKQPTAGLPNAVQAVITNVGSAALTGLVVTLNVTGANTFTSMQTVASLAAGTNTTVTFAPLPATFVAGVNTLTVTIPTDANPANNTLATQQTVNTTGTFSYVPSNQTNTSGSFVVGSAATGGIFATRYTTSAAATVTSVSVYIGDAGASATSSTSVGKTVYGVVLSPAGAILGQSTNYVIQTADVGTYHTFAITTPPAVAAGGSFLAGLAQPATTGLRFYPLVIQTENPTRSNTYFSVPLAGGTPVDQSVGTGGANSGFGRLMMEATVNTTLATSKELQRAITIYPNPSATGVFNLDIHNANAKNLLGVEVVNQLGQRVYTGSAHDNLTNTVDLSNLAGGLYHLQVRNGEEFSSQQISIVK